jgi:hypothetical protein
VRSRGFRLCRLASCTRGRFNAMSLFAVATAPFAAAAALRRARE